MVNCIQIICSNTSVYYLNDLLQNLFSGSLEGSLILFPTGSPDFNRINFCFQGYMNLIIADLIIRFIPINTSKTISEVSFFNFWHQMSQRAILFNINADYLVQFTSNLTLFVTFNFYQEQVQVLKIWQSQIPIMKFSQFTIFCLMLLL